MELEKIIVISSLGITVLLICLIAFYYTKRSSKALIDSQELLSDKELIEFINDQPDKLISSNTLVEDFGLSKFDAKARIRHLHYNGLLKALSTNNGLKYYYTLSKPIVKSFDLELTDDAFMTIEDLMLIFKHYEYQVTLQELCLSTGLPVKVLIKEMKLFEKEKVVKRLLSTNNSGISYQRVYALCEPYRSNPESYLAIKDVNFELKEIYQNIRKT